MADRTETTASAAVMNRQAPPRISVTERRRDESA